MLNPLSRAQLLTALVLGAAAALTFSVPGDAQRAVSVKPARPDLADTAQGSYFGDVISDARGSSRSDVRITVTKIGPNKVRVSSDYPRLPAFTASLTRAMDTVQNVSGAEVFLLDLSKIPRTLNLTVADASWYGTKE
jgi:hypothetical protein